MENSALSKGIWFIILFICTTQAFAQDYQNVSFVVDEATKTINCMYNPTGSPLISQDSIKAIVYSLGIGQEDPDAQEVHLTKSGNFWHAELSYKESDVIALFSFIDKLDNIDNNKGNGYVTFISEKGLTKQGAFASIAYLYAGAWDAKTFMLTRQVEKAHSYYEKEFSANPNLKRTYFRWYLSTFDLNDDAELTKFRAELSQFANYEDLTEWELLAISRFYATIKQPKLAKNYEDLIFKRYPGGSWSMQMATMDIQKEFTATDNLKQKSILYGRFKEQTKNYTDEWPRRYIELRKGLTMLSKLTPYYADSDQIDLWLKEVNELSDEFKYPTLIFGAKTLYEHGNATVAEGLAKQSVDWMKSYLDTTYRNTAERSYYTTQQIKQFRHKRYAEYLNIYGQILASQNKLNESVFILRQASIIYGKKSDNTINQHYVEALKKSGRLEEAAMQMQEFIKTGKSNADIEEKYKAAMKLNSLPDSLTASKRARLVRDVHNQLISELMPPISFLDYKGNPVNIGSYQNKIVVIDFWATWCAPCIAGFDSMQKIVEQYKTDQEVVFLFVNTKEYNSEGEQQAKSLFRDRNYSFILLFDDKGKGLVSSGGTGLPTKLVVDKSGKIRFRITGLEGTVDEQVAELSTMIETIR